MTRIVRSLRGLARTDSPKRQDTDLPVVIDSALDILRGRLKRHNVEVVTNYDPDSTVMCVPDPNQPGRAQSAGQCPAGHRGDQANRRTTEDPYQTVGRRNAARRSATTAPASIPITCPSYSIPSSPPRTWAKGRGWGCRSSTTSFAPTAAVSRSIASLASAPASGFIFPCNLPARFHESSHQTYPVGGR